MSKYHALTKHLSARGETRVAMTFAEIEAILGQPLPGSARAHRPWRANSSHGHVQARGWLDAGYRSEQVDLAAERLVFARRAIDPPPPAATAAEVPAGARGRHPLIGCMAGTITLPEGTDLTAPVFTDAEMEAFLDRKTALLRGGPP